VNCVGGLLLGFVPDDCDVKPALAKADQLSGLSKEESARLLLETEAEVPVT